MNQSGPKVFSESTRTGKKSPAAALKDCAGRANPTRARSELRAALKQSLKEESAGKGRRFRSGREAIQWLESCGE